MKNYVLLSGIIFLLVLIATATGAFYRTPGSPIEYTTVRGEQALYRELACIAMILPGSRSKGLSGT